MLCRGRAGKEWSWVLLSRWCWLGCCRTLTPFGFQGEDRTLWEAKDTYAAMDPFRNADKIKKPLLIIHGTEDENTGCAPIQVRPPPSPPPFQGAQHVC